MAPEKFVAAVEEHGAQIVGISALMTTTMPAMKRTIDALDKAGLRERVKVMIGGAPVNQAYADEIGADGYARDSTLAVVARQGAARSAGDGMSHEPRGWEIVERVKAGELLVFDGGYGTALFAAGLLNGACPELWNDTHPEVVRGIHRGYFDAGSDLVETNTFGGTRLKLNEYQIGDRTRELNDKGARWRARCARRAATWRARSARRACSPPSTASATIATDEEYLETFKEQAEALAEGGVDIFAVETMMFPQEAIAGDPGVQGGGRSARDGDDVLPVRGDARPRPHHVGREPGRRGAEPARRGRRHRGDELRARPRPGHRHHPRDAGGHRRAAHRLPERGAADHDGRCTTYELGPEAMAKDYPALLDAGCNIVGGCCGSGPEHIRLIAEVVRSRRKR